MFCVGIAVAFLSFAVAEEPRRAERIVFLGDSITDGGTLPLLFKQALSDAGLPTPVCINAGVASDTAADMRKRLERDVLVHRPTLVVLSAGINDVLHAVSAADYEKDVRGIADRLKADKVPMLLLSTTVLGPKHEKADKRLGEFNAVLARLADEYGFRLAQVNRLMRAASDAGPQIIEPDQVHLTFAGYRIMTRALLDALGQTQAAVPEKLKLEPLPGLITPWRLRSLAAESSPLDDQAIGRLTPDASWKTISLPDPVPQEQWWFEQERQRGFALSLDKRVGPGKSYQGFATLMAQQPRRVYFNTGGQLQTIWLNGTRIYRSEGWSGFHPGKERMPADLKWGDNTIVVESTGEFFLSVTDSNDW